ncbi:MAG: tetratricopeptide repeat protein [Thermogemmatispora sp.]|uniref:tetratricopeptide repeat protein n=1 Tax=Thermogemmatispora sp. TaxID=1968838 RepID=UPI00262B8AA2|nr:tetratricopeptide repeat protein [Thermogemmatispora sp.]MBX5457775.1 tetratricopeptide repeat protein [Thermogemmatispora sp.]
MALGQDWSQIIHQSENERFVGREQELTLFLEELRRVPPRTLIFYLTGQAGVGKTTLLRRFQAMARELGFLVAECDERQRDVLAVLGHLAAQFDQHGLRLKAFEDRHRLYYQRLHEIENDPQAPRGQGGLSVRMLLRLAFVAGEMLPVVGPAFSYLSLEEVEELASEWGRYLLRKLGNREEIELLREPEHVLSQLFFADLNRIAERWPVLLCLDNLEATRPALFWWLLRLPEYRPSGRIRLVLAGRDPLDNEWGVLRGVTRVIRLDVFTEEEAEAFLDLYHVRDPLRRQEIIEVSGRLPVLMSWLAAPRESGGASYAVLPAGDMVERFLRWVHDPVLREAALLGALPRVLNRDVLACLLRCALGEQAPHVERVFSWLIALPFVSERGEGWRYHSVVRRMMLEYLRRRSPVGYRELQGCLATFYRQQLEALYADGQEHWQAARWQEGTLNTLYHGLLADLHSGWNALLSCFMQALYQDRRFAARLVEMAALEEVRRTLEREQRELLELMQAGLRAMEEGDWATGLRLFDRLCQIAELPPRARAAAFFFRGRVQRYRQAYTEALVDLSQAIALDETNLWAFVERSRVLRRLRRYSEALEDLTRVVTLNPLDARSWASRGQVYTRLGRYEEALQDFERALALDEGYVWALVHRAEVCRLRGAYEQALADLERALAISPHEARAWGERGEVCRLLGHYEEALTCLAQALALRPDYAWALVCRGQVLAALGRREEALTDLERALALDATLEQAAQARAALLAGEEAPAISAPVTQRLDTARTQPLPPLEEGPQTRSLGGEEAPGGPSSG